MPSASTTELASLMVGRPVQLTVDKGAAEARRRRPRRRRRHRARRGRRRARRRRVVPGPRRRDLRAGGRAGQRPDRDDRGAGRADDPDVGQDHDRGLGRHHALHRRGARPRRRLRARGPAARRPGRRLLRRREPRARPLRPAAVRVRARDEPGGDRAQRHRAGGRVRRAHAVDDRVGQHALGRQPAEGGARAGAVAAVEAADRGAADARPRRRLDGVRAPADRGRARPGRGRRARLHRAGRGARAGRPDRRDVPGQDRG